MAHFFKNIKEAEVKVGALVIACLVILFFSYSWLNDWFVGNKYNQYQILFDSVSSLDKGGSVFFRGMLVGKINNLTITSDGVLAEILVDNTLKISEDALFQVKDKDMMGTKALDILQGESPYPLRTDKVYTGTSLPGFSELISNANKLLGQLDGIMTKLEQDDNLVKKVDKLITTADKSLTEFNTLMVNVNRSELFTALSEVKKVSQSLNTLIKNNDQLLTEALTSATKTLTKVDSLIIITEKTLAKITPTPESSVTKLLTEDELYQNLAKSIKELENLVNDIKANPRKYFKFSIF